MTLTEKAKRLLDQHQENEKGEAHAFISYPHPEWIDVVELAKAYLKMREALEWYAIENNYEESDCDAHDSLIDFDYGQRARDVLKEFK